MDRLADYNLQNYKSLAISIINVKNQFITQKLISRKKKKDLPIKNKIS